MTKTSTEAGMPIAITLEPGTYLRCTCGRSRNLPFCDGSHPAGGPVPVRFEIEARQKVYICSCGESATQPFCDDSCGRRPVDSPGSDLPEGR